jgi:chaperonin GroEL
MNDHQFLSSGWNVLSDKELKERFSNVFRRVAETLTKTLGPYGETTIIEKHGNYHITKDGWTVLKNIRFADPISNTIMQMLYDIAAPLAIKVGDGTTTSIVAANEMLKLFKDDQVIKGIRPRDFNDLLSSCIDKVSNTILANAQQINKDEDASFNEIYRIAKISTNDHKEIPKMIQDIYKVTRNPSIDYTVSKTNKTSYEIIQGYKLQYATYLDAIFANNDNGNCIIEEPMMVMLDFKFEYTDNLKSILSYIQMRAKEMNKKVVILAPFYDKYALDHIRRDIMDQFRMTRELNTIYGRVSLISSLSEALYNDFAVMTGGTIIREIDIEEADDQKKLFDLLEKSFGYVGEMTIGKDYITISDLKNRNEDLYKLAVNEARTTYEELYNRDRQKNVITTDAFDSKKRLSKLNCSMGVMYVGGSSELEKEANKDAVEDAIKACESAYNYGYNVGGNLSIINAIACQKYESDFEHRIYSLLGEAFTNVFELIVENKYKDEDGNFSTSDIEHMNKIMDTFIKVPTGYGYDIISEDITDEVINPCYTDIEILRAVSSIVYQIISSNQYLSIVIKEAKE